MLCQASLGWEVSRSDQKGHCGGKEAVPPDLEVVLELLISGQECHTLHVLIVLDLTVDLVDEEGFYSIVKLVLPKVATNVFHSIMRPVSKFNSVEKTVVLSDPQSVLKSVKVNSRVQGVSR